MSSTFRKNFQSCEQRPEIRDFIKRIPKLRGRGKNINTSIQKDVVVVSLGQLSKVFKNGDVVSPSTLLQNKLIGRSSGNLPKVKILSNGTLDKKIKVEGCSFSATAKLAIEKAGGEIKA